MMRWLKGTIVGIVVLTTLVQGMMIDVQLRYANRIFSTIDAAPVASTVIVLGASIKPNGGPSDALRDRLLVGADLYHSGRVKTVLVSGDDGRYHANEVATMRAFLLEQEIPEKNILVDGQGYRTYETCTRAYNNLNITHAILVTQRFHLGRALYLCNQLGMDAVGMTADRTPYQRILYFTLRDLLASVEAWWDINIHSPSPPV